MQCMLPLHKGRPALHGNTMTVCSMQMRMLELETVVRRTRACCLGEASFEQCLVGSLHSISQEGSTPAWRDAAAGVLGMLSGQ